MRKRYYSRYVITWQLSNTLDSDFCVDALEEALSGKKQKYSIVIKEVSSPLWHSLVVLKRQR